MFGDCINVPPNPCPDVFQYRFVMNIYVGEVIVPYDGSQYNELTVNVTYPFADNVKKLGISLITPYEEIPRKRIIKYLITFPYQHVLPFVRQITYNGKVLCFGPLPMSNLATLLWETKRFLLLEVPDSPNQIAPRNPFNDRFQNQEDNPTMSPCPDVFQYKSKNNYIYGQITVPYKKVGDLELSVNASVPVFDNSDKMGIELILDTPGEDLAKSKYVTYKVVFPYQFVRPSIQEIRFNGVVYCSAPLPKSKVVTKLWQKARHRVELDDADKTTTKAADDSSTTKNPNKSTEKPTEKSTESFTERFSSTSTEGSLSTTSKINPESKNDLPTYNTCGRANLDKIDESFVRIVGGDETPEHAYPWLVALMYRSPGKTLEYKCTANLISKRHVLTAAHCVKTSKEDIVLILGKSNITSYTPQDHVHVKDITIHPGYKQGVSPTYGDIAILTLNNPVQFQDFILPICLWSKNLNSSKYSQGTVAGWGTDEISPNTATTNQILMPIVPEVECLRSNEAFHYLTSNMTFCAGSKNAAGPCKGDSGAGFMVREGDKFYLRGLVSTSLAANGKCDLRNYVIFTDVSKYLDWIQDHINELN